jgi:hypothetical protein
MSNVAGDAFSAPSFVFAGADGPVRVHTNDRQVSRRG